MSTGNNTCYSYDGPLKGFVADPYFQACGTTADGEYTQCCQPGTYCLADGFCQFDSSFSRKTSQYFAAECTDPTGKADACKGYCRNSNIYTYVIWTGNDWQCCYGPKVGDGDCRSPAGERFNAPAPAKLSTSTFLVNPAVAASILSTAIPPQLSRSGITDKDALQTFITSALKDGNDPTWFAAMPTAVQTYYVAPSLLPQASSNDNNSSSSNSSDSSRGGGESSDVSVKVGVPVAIVVALILLGFGLGFFFIRRRRAQGAKRGYDSSESSSSAKEADATTISMAESKNAYVPRVSELAGSPVRAELPSPMYESNVTSPLAATRAPNTAAVGVNGFVDEKRGAKGPATGQGQTESEFALGPHPAYMPFELDGRSPPVELEGPDKDASLPHAAA